MRPRVLLLLMGFVIAVLSLLALTKNYAGSEKIIGSAISDKIHSVPSSPNLYFVVFLAIGIISIVVALMERKVVY